MTLEEWAARLRRESTVSVVQHEPSDCAELATLLEWVLNEQERLRRALGATPAAQSIAEVVTRYLGRAP